MFACDQQPRRRVSRRTKQGRRSSVTALGARRILGWDCCGRTWRVRFPVNWAAAGTSAQVNWFWRADGLATWRVPLCRPKAHQATTDGPLRWQSCSSPTLQYTGQTKTVPCSACVPSAVQIRRHHFTQRARACLGPLPLVPAPAARSPCTHWPCLGIDLCSGGSMPLCCLSTWIIISSGYPFRRLPVSTSMCHMQWRRLLLLVCIWVGF